MKEQDETAVWHWQRGYDAGARDLAERQIENDRLNRMLSEASGETLRTQDELGALLHAVEAERDTYRKALWDIANETRLGGQWTLAEVHDIAANVIGGRTMASEGSPRKLPGQADEISETCLSCRFWHELDRLSDMPSRAWGMCQRYPPHDKFQDDENDMEMSDFPWTWNNQWCGEWSATR